MRKSEFLMLKELKSEPHLNDMFNMDTGSKFDVAVSLNNDIMTSF